MQDKYLEGKGFHVNPEALIVIVIDEEFLTEKLICFYESFDKITPLAWNGLSLGLTLNCFHFSLFCFGRASWIQELLVCSNFDVTIVHLMII